MCGELCELCGGYFQASWSFDLTGRNSYWTLNFVVKVQGSPSWTASMNLLPVYIVPQDLWDFRVFSEVPSRSVLYFVASFFSGSSCQDNLSGRMKQICIFYPVSIYLSIYIQKRSLSLPGADFSALHGESPFLRRGKFMAFGGNFCSEDSGRGSASSVAAKNFMDLINGGYLIMGSYTLTLHFKEIGVEEIVRKLEHVLTIIITTSIINMVVSSTIVITTVIVSITVASIVVVTITCIFGVSIIIDTSEVIAWGWHARCLVGEWWGKGTSKTKCGSNHGVLHCVIEM
eukprot:Gb_40156 [translate_table: standard]